VGRCDLSAVLRLCPPFDRTDTIDRCDAFVSHPRGNLIGLKKVPRRRLGISWLMGVLSLWIDGLVEHGTRSHLLFAADVLERTG